MARFLFFLSILVAMITAPCIYKGLSCARQTGSNSCVDSCLFELNCAPGGCHGAQVCCDACCDACQLEDVDESPGRRLDGCPLGQYWHYPIQEGGCFHESTEFVSALLV